MSFSLLALVSSGLGYLLAKRSIVHILKSINNSWKIGSTSDTDNLKPYQYFEYFLTKLPERVSQKKDSTFSLEDLMPWSLKLPMTCRKIK